MNKKALAVFGSAVVVAVVIIAIIAGASGSATPQVIKSMKSTAQSFPVPSGAQVAFPDGVVKKPPTYTKGWRLTGALDATCTTWADAYRTWIGAQNVGQVTGDYNASQSCSYTGPKDGFKATLQVAVYGTDPQPQITLTITS
jgi:hypothetical protein